MVDRGLISIIVSLSIANITIPSGILLARVVSTKGSSDSYLDSVKIKNILMKLNLLVNRTTQWP